MLIGASPNITGSIGQPRIPTHNTVTAAIANELGSPAPRASAMMPVAKLSPTTAAATPARTAWTPRWSPNRPYSAPTARMIANGPMSIANAAVKAPAPPFSRRPTSTAILIPLAPGRLWPIAISVRNCASLTQPRRCTTSR